MYHGGMRPHGSPEELERRRRRAIQILQQGATVTEVARRIGGSHSSVILWRRMLRRGGTAGLKAQPAPGRPTRLEARQVRRLPALLRKGALAWGYTTDLWTTTRIDPARVRHTLSSGARGTTLGQAPLVLPETRTPSDRTR